MNVSTDFAPPFKLIAPYFIIGSICLFLSVILLFWFDVEYLHNLNNITLAWVHLFLLGFVMMVIFGAMAQLVPVVLEVGHFAVEMYYIIYPLLLIGTSLMVVGFYWYPLLLSFGGVIAFIAFGIFLFETFATILKVKKINFVILSVLLANICLFFGLIVGILLALNYGGFLNIDVMSLLEIHVYLVFVGYVGITVMGMSLVLLPMFWLSHDFTWVYVKSALALLMTSICVISFGLLFGLNFLEQIGYGMSMIALILYFIQIFIIYKKRVRVEKDIYFKSMVFSYFSLFISIVLGVIYLFYPTQNILLTLGWFGIFGFVFFIIMGHLYKIIPFLVWYERFSIHVGKKKVPMLADMIPKKSASIQFLFNCIGTAIVSLGVLSQVDLVFKSGIILLLIGMVIFLKDVFYMINYKEKQSV